MERDRLIYARSKLGGAIWKLATGIGEIKSRLSDAYIELAIIQDGDLPEDLSEEWKMIKRDLTNGKMKYRADIKDGKIVEVPVGRLASTLRYMRKKKAEDIAIRICLLKSKVDNYMDGLDE